jgi:hypothetical protein
MGADGDGRGVANSPPARSEAPYDDPVAVRYRCASCGNLTRFDVVTTRRTRAFHHYSTGGDLAVEDEEVLEESVDAVTCRWCGPSGRVAVVAPEGGAGP